jgi:hypothetical protein
MADSDSVNLGSNPGPPANNFNTLEKTQALTILFGQRFMAAETLSGPMSASREAGGNSPNTRTFDPRVVAAVGRDLLPSMLKRDAGRALRIVWVGGNFQ